MITTYTPDLARKRLDTLIRETIFLERLMQETLYVEADHHDFSELGTLPTCCLSPLKEIYHRLVCEKEALEAALTRFENEMKHYQIVIDLDPKNPAKGAGA